MTQRLRTHVACSLRTQVQLPVSTWWLIDIHRLGSDVFFWPTWAPDLHIVYIYLQEKHTCTFLKQAKGKNLVIVARTFNSRTWEAEAGDDKAD